MNPENDPKLDAKIMRFYSRHNRRSRWRRWWPIIARIGDKAAGPVLAGGLILVGTGLYQDHQRLAELYNRGGGDAVALAVPPEAIAATNPAPQAVVPQKDIWAAGKWEEAASRYIADQLAAAPSSANPPQHRARHR